MGIVAERDAQCENMTSTCRRMSAGWHTGPRCRPMGRWVLLAEMGGYGSWVPCRVVPWTAVRRAARWADGRRVHFRRVVPRWQMDISDLEGREDSTTFGGSVFRTASLSR